MTDFLLENISKSFGDKKIFNNYNLKIEAGEFVCISGISGIGKSTLLNIMGLLDYPDSGRIVIKGIENPKLQRKEGRRLLQKEICYVFQNYGLIDESTVRYNLEICMYHSKKTKKDMIEALEKVGLTTDILTKKVFTLSGGEQQRVALARIYLKEASIILADEPTGSLDAENRNTIMQILQKFNEAGKTIVIVSHDKEIEKWAKRVINL